MMTMNVKWEFEMKQEEEIQKGAMKTKAYQIIY